MSIILLIILSWQTSIVMAQSNAGLSSVEVSLFPEFNRPSMLVVFEIELDESNAVPKPMSFQIPKDAQLLAIYNREANNSVIQLEGEFELIGDWKSVQFTTTTHKIRIEYYDPNLIKQGNQRSFEFKWLSIYPVDEISVSLRQPLGASDVITEPNLGEKVAGSEGLDYYTADFGGVPAGSVFFLSLSYTKNTGNVAYPALEVEPALPINQEAAGRTPPPSSVVLWLLMVVVAVLIMVGLYYWWFRVNVLDKRERLVQGVGITNPEKQVIFCHECGMRSKPGDTFCSNCGTELRKPTQFERPPRH